MNYRLSDVFTLFDKAEYVQVYDSNSQLLVEGTLHDLCTKASKFEITKKHSMRSLVNLSAFQNSEHIGTRITIK